MKTITIQNLVCRYNVKGKGKNIILLHGWGQNIEMMEPIQNALSKKYRVWALDMPGSGESQDPYKPFDVNDYASFLYDFVVALKINNPTLIGHSFGGRVAIVYANHYETNNLVLMDAAGILPKRGFWYYFRTYTYKATKIILSIPVLKSVKNALSNKAGSSDYRALSDDMKKTFIKVVNQDLIPLLNKINQPTLLIWGSNDDATPLWMGEKMEQLIPNAELVVYEGAGHYAYLERINEVNIVIEHFLKVNGGVK